jgi:DEAD/DEAH box helicase domain-containing protein
MEIIVLDLETQALFPTPEALVFMALAVTWDEENRYRTWFENQAENLIDELSNFDRIVGFNLSFDFRILSQYGDTGALRPKAFDIFALVRRAVGCPVSLAALAREVLWEDKLTTGPQTVHAWQRGDVDAVIEHCERDVDLTKALYEELEYHGNFFFEGKEIISDDFM